MKKLYTLFLLSCSILFAADADIRLSSIGFTPEMSKKVSVTAECEQFTLVDANTGETAYTGTLSDPVYQKDVDQSVRIADFTLFVDPGWYILNIENVGQSVPFEIGADVCAFPYTTAMRAFYLWRCGTAVSGDHKGDHFEHDACHLNDALKDALGRPGQRRDGTGGWHDAGDYGKYVTNGAFTLGCLFLAWDHFQNKLESVELDLPETAPGYPDFLKELKWETDWLLKMPYPDGSGRVSHKLTRLNFSGMIMPENDDAERYFTDWSTTAVADFAAVMAMAARYFAPLDSAYADTCLQAALSSYQALRDHPQHKRFQQGDFHTGAYASDDRDDRLWAAAELWETTGDSSYLHDFEQQVRNSQPRMRPGMAQASEKRHVDFDWDWGNLRNLGVFTYVLSEQTGRDPELLQTLHKHLQLTADDIVETADRDVYGRTLGERYQWGCNGSVARQTITLYTAYLLFHNKDYVRAASDAVAHLFGRNVYNRSYVTGLGHNPPMNPHSRRSVADDVQAPWPGYIVGGGHSATDWVDVHESYQTNEIAVNWQAALVYALAIFL
ncbi:MAG: glycoside hydrolase family 9 protein [candidate division KSB1 bacterium]|nr:glycoside hydrolase family 9 protein [candidate division KSB1 bacterium]